MKFIDKRRHLAIVLAAVILPATALNAGTILTTDDPNADGAGATNTAIDEHYASNVTAKSDIAIDGNGNGQTNAKVTGAGTPDIALTWAAEPNGATGTVRWEFHDLPGGGALQLNESAGKADAKDAFTDNAVFQITFTPTATAGVTIKSFNFIGDTDGDKYQYDWRFVRVEDASVVAHGKTAGWTTDTAAANAGAPTVAPNFTGEVGKAYRLELVQSIGSTGDGVNIYIDNLEFGQTR